MNEKGKFVTERGDEKWLWEITVLCDTSHHVHGLNTKLKVQQKLIYDMFGAVRAFEMKLKLFRKHLENVNLCQFFL
jgi:hypothetical protein